MKTILIGMTNTSVVSGEGLLLSDQTGTEVSERIKKLLPPKSAASLIKALNPAVLEENNKLHWLQTYGVLAGKTFHQGDTFVTNFFASDTGESWAMYSIDTVTNLNGKPIALVRYYVSDKEDIQSPEMKKVIDGPLDAFFKLPNTKESNQRTAGERWMLCESMLILEEKSLALTRLPGRRNMVGIKRTFEIK